MVENIRPSLRFRVARKLKQRYPRLALQMLALDVDDPAAILLRARIENELDGAAHAAEVIESSHLMERDSTLLYYAGFYRERAHDYEPALAHYTESLTHTDSAATRYHRALVYQKLQQLDNCFADAEIAAALDPTDPRFHELLLSVSGNEPLWKKLEILKTGLDSHADSLTWRRHLAELALQMKDWVTAAEEFDWCAAHHGNGDDTLRAGIAYFRMNKVSLAIDRWSSSSKGSKERDVQELGAGVLLQRMSLWDLASEAYAIRIRTSGETPARNHALGFSLLRQYRWKDALPRLRRACQQDPENKQFWYDLGLCLERMERYSDAAVAYKNSLATNSPDDYRRYRMISCLSASGAIGEAFDALPIHPAHELTRRDSLPWNEEQLREELHAARMNSDAHACTSVAVAAVESNRFELAATAYSAAIQRQLAHSSDLYLRLSDVLQRTQDVAGAVHYYLKSRQFGRPFGVLVTAFTKTKAQRLSATYLEYCETTSVDSSTFLYESNHGSAFTCSVRQVYEALLGQTIAENTKHVIVLNDGSRLPSDLPLAENVIIVARESDLYLEYLASAKFLINNNTFPPYFSRREEQKYLNMWHGTPLKTLGKDIRSGAMDHRNATRNLLHVTHLAAPNEFTANVLLDRYDVRRIFPGLVSVTGAPRMDRSINITSERRLAIRKRLHATQSDRLILFAPTWRGDLANRVVDHEQLAQDLEAMQSADGVVVFRGHPLMEAGLDGLSTSVQTVPADIDSNDLLGAVDVLVSDYSSIAVDAVGAGVRTVLYVYDLEDYQEQRGLIVDIDQLPMEIARSREDLLRILGGECTGRFESDYGCYSEMWSRDDGDATGRVVDFFLRDRADSLIDTYSSRMPTEAILFQGHFIPNGVTSSAIELDKYLVSRRVGVSLSVEPQKIVGFPERRVFFDSLPTDVYALPLVGVPIRTPEESWLNSMYMKHDRLWSDCQMRLLFKAYEREYRRLYGAAEFDAAVCFEGYSRYWALVMAGSPQRTRNVIYLHTDMLPERMRRFPYLDGVFNCYSEYDVLASVSSSVRESNARHLSDLIPSGVEHFAVPNLIDVDHIVDMSKQSPPGRFSEFIEDHPGHVFVNTGRLSPEKGQDQLLEAFAIARNEGDALVIIGDGPVARSLQSQANRLGLAQDVYFAGYTPNPYAIMAHCDTFVLSSRYEGQGIVLLEALALGLAVVSTRIPGPMSIVSDGVGILCYLTPKSLAEAMAASRSAKSSRSVRFSVTEYVDSARRSVDEALQLTPAVKNGDD